MSEARDHIKATLESVDRLHHAAVGIMDTMLDGMQNGQLLGIENVKRMPTSIRFSFCKRHFLLRAYFAAQPLKTRGTQNGTLILQEGNVNDDLKEVFQECGMIPFSHETVGETHEPLSSHEIPLILRDLLYNRLKETEAMRFPFPEPTQERPEVVTKAQR